MSVSPQTNLTQNGRSSDSIFLMLHLPGLYIKRMTRIMSSGLLWAPFKELQLRA